MELITLPLIAAALILAAMNFYTDPIATAGYTALALAVVLVTMMAGALVSRS